MNDKAAPWISPFSRKDGAAQWTERLPAKEEYTALVEESQEGV